jgi:hypothetical protein
VEVPGADACSPPQARFEWSPRSPQEGDRVRFTSRSQANATRSIRSEEWDLDGDGAFDDGRGRNVSWIYRRERRYEVGLRVTDSAGDYRVTKESLDVSPARPTVGGFAVDRTDVVYRELVRITGRLSVGDDQLHRVVLEADEFPFDAHGFWRRKELTIQPNSNFKFRIRPERNTRYRVVIDDYVESDPVTVFADWGVDWGWRIRRRRTIEVGFIFYAPEEVSYDLLGRKAHFYYAHSRTSLRGRRVRTTRIGLTRRDRPIGYARFRVRRPRNSDLVGFCIREVRPDGFGRFDPNDRRCGRRTFVFRSR